MMTAQMARTLVDKNVNNEAKSSHFKFAIKKIENYIKEACEHGKTSFRYNICALEYTKHPGQFHGEFPSQALRKAIANELQKNGYSYREMNVMNIAGRFNECFEVSW